MSECLPQYKRHVDMVPKIVLMELFQNENSAKQYKSLNCILEYIPFITYEEVEFDYIL